MTPTRWIALAAALKLAAPAAAQVKLNGAGATFPNIIYQDWMLTYNKTHPDVQLNYQSIGSGGGIRQFSDGTVDFGATDAPMKDSSITAINGNVLHLPTVLGGDVPTYNLPEVKETLRFTPDVLADIYLGKITKWSDARITSVNRGVKLPDADIVVVHRSDGSGTSFIWTDYLSKVSSECEQKVGRGTSVNWPVGLGGKGNEGATATVKQTPGSARHCLAGRTEAAAKATPRWRSGGGPRPRGQARTKRSGNAPWPSRRAPGSRAGPRRITAAGRPSGPPPARYPSSGLRRPPP